jgi:hypothetical protein
MWFLRPKRPPFRFFYFHAASGLNLDERTEIAWRRHNNMRPISRIRGATIEELAAEFAHQRFGFISSASAGAVQLS